MQVGFYTFVEKDFKKICIKSKKGLHKIHAECIIMQKKDGKYARRQLYKSLLCARIPRDIGKFDFKMYNNRKFIDKQFII
jgi:hypothetical protein